MDVKTFRAKTMPEALALVRRELGPDAAVLHTREVRGIKRWFSAGRIEVMASTGVNVPSRMPAAQRTSAAATVTTAAPATTAASYAHASTQAAALPDYRAKFREDAVSTKLDDLCSLVEQLCRQSESKTRPEMPEGLFKLFTDLIEAEVAEELARELIERLRQESPGDPLDDPMLAKARLARMIEEEVRVTGPIRVGTTRPHVVALVGPTGVGKTTTIAKLAANFRLREKLRVGLITVDTYRIAAVEQLRTYADIMDLPMEVVSTPREMRQAVARLSGVDVVFMDTAGRSPRDELKIQELKTMLAEANPNEVYLVLSSAASAASLARTAEQFASVGTTALVLTKLDEATGMGNLLPVLRGSHLPLAYLTDGQNVPDDIRVADQRHAARLVLGMEA
ncbi:MAG: flagellar biosynthesis protein FlhF [Planctomycetota bacterium]|nr:MAG: flagellar biosynthesis protein FlhF [Planctomycetota bacterium]